MNATSVSPSGLVHFSGELAGQRGESRTELAGPPDEWQMTEQNSYTNAPLRQQTRNTHATPSNKRINMQVYTDKQELYSFLYKGKKKLFKTFIIKSDIQRLCSSIIHVN
jgi:hypothetical protein